MHHASKPLLLLVVGGALAVGCGGESLEGHYWSLKATGVNNTCSSEPANQTDEFEYRVQYDGTDVQIAIGDDVFAEGIANGCAIAYESIVWAEDVGGHEVSWRIIGNAMAQQGGNACGLTGVDWSGTEIFEIVTSDNPALSPGCSYEMTVEGKYLEQVK